MNRKYIIFEFLVGLIIFSMIINHIPKNYSSNGVLSPSDGGFSFSGDYEGDLSIMYFEENWTFSTWTNQNSSTNIINYNASYWDQEYKARSLDIRAGNLYNYSGIGLHTIANNTSEQISLTPSLAFAQEFTAPALSEISEIMIYLDFVSILNRYYDIFIFDENLEEQIAWGFTYDPRVFVDEWVSIYPGSNVLLPGEKYNIVLRVWYSLGGYNSTFDYWKAENYSSPIYNKGITRQSLDGVNWTTVSDDNTLDMLCTFSYTKLIDPMDIDLKFIINDEIIIPTYQITPWGFAGYEAFTSFTFNAPLTNDINLTISSNQTIPTLDIEIVTYYFMLINGSGTYSADENRIEWTITYPYEEISFGWPPPIFLFEKDWSFIDFFDPDDIELSDVYFGPIDFYNKSFYGITIFFGPPLEEGNYTGIFQSPSYCHSIITKVKQGNDFVTKPSLQLGQTVKVEAGITNPFNNPVSGGIGQIVLYSPSGEVIHNETGLTSVNGTMSSSEISLSSGIKEGTYETKVFWTNGREAAIYSMKIVIKAPVDIIFWVLLSVGLALVSTPVALVSRKYIRQRNWQKSLKNLFVLTKDGLNIYEYSFGIEIQDPALISAMISALTSFVREATGSKKALRTVDQEDKKVILNHGNYITIA
ncbi:MAG: hypothetical protein KGD58_13235, partial [Candidatus Lokiarchaeota archaeon]|nr:hypothetical protein [Candidatus Lokiarchaeota archaeon]